LDRDNPVKGESKEIAMPQKYLPELPEDFKNALLVHSSDALPF
jgi:hypothetical protein